jgi:fructokinase
MNKLYGALEAGGTKMVAAVGRDSGKIVEKTQLPTAMPGGTMAALFAFFDRYALVGMGIAAFGPVDLNKRSKTYGHITTTPKKGWANFNIVGAFSERYHIPIGFDTDVNGSLLGELTYGELKSESINSAIYMTIGTGIGVGVYINGGLLHGLQHPEAGHITLKRHENDIDFVSNCPFHPDCFEGLASGSAMEKRWGRKAYELSDNKAAWEIEGYYIGQAVADYILCYSPQRIILGGGVMKEKQLLPIIHENVIRNLNGYIGSPLLTGENIGNYITLASLGGEQGILGALALGINA